MVGLYRFLFFPYFYFYFFIFFIIIIFCDKLVNFMFRVAPIPAYL